MPSFDRVAPLFPKIGLSSAGRGRAHIVYNNRYEGLASSWQAGRFTTALHVTPTVVAVGATLLVPVHSTCIANDSVASFNTYLPRLVVCALSTMY